MEEFPKRSYPHCPAEPPPPPRPVDHPYIPGVKLETRPRFNRYPVAVTLDGRLAEKYAPREYFYEEPPLVSSSFSHVFVQLRFIFSFN
jgi:hypothetical protein